MNDPWINVPTTLVVHLDGTLLRSDMLLESIWSALGQDWRRPILSARALLRGRAALERHLAAASNLDVRTLRFDARVIEHVRQWRASGGRTALVTATDRALAERIAGHLGLFDEVHGSDGERNLTGTAKAAFLSDRFADG